MKVYYKYSLTDEIKRIIYDSKINGKEIDKIELEEEEYEKFCREQLLFQSVPDILIYQGVRVIKKERI